MSNEFLSTQAKQLRSLAARKLTLPIEFQHDQLSGSLLDRSMQLFEQFNEVLIELSFSAAHRASIMVIPYTASRDHNGS
jgi:hypothetical protein